MAIFNSNNQRQNNRPSPHHNPVSNKIYGPDQIGLVTFHDSAQPLVWPTEAHNFKLQQGLISLPSQVSGTGTNLTAGLRLATKMASQAPAGCLKRIWLLTDGAPNRELDGLRAAVTEARRRRININTIGFGNPGANSYDPELLKKIAAATHNGHFVPVDSLRALSQALQSGPRQQGRNHRKEVTVLAIDCSLSMTLQMEGRQRIDVVTEALAHLLHYKQKRFA